ncbi:hypothetical protein M413DRAFT_10658 [Hebeloma cylindrosporum]|uniref:DUF1365-domain-containing protein n=1 Tax=Hebeloma cylindrosporum TaxID=76867 RepID=A0A0C3BYS4_HEBCY|nr:hypothetical protein M413DRAFT_10658 [Hebeloma cylindrosporum h7]
MTMSGVECRSASVKSTPQGYLLHNQVTHARLLPVESANAFTYPTVSLLVSLDALEGRKLDLGWGCVFGYGGLWGRITGLRPNPYLTQQPGSIRSKLEEILMLRGFLSGKRRFQDAWMMTMPSFLGYEGINPLSVYFCYDLEGDFWLTILEIHNTFGESHVHVLEIGTNEDQVPSSGYDHQWTFPREFHVSPFNDRSGFYTVSIKRPSHSPMPVTTQFLTPYVAPRPSVRVHLYTATEEDSTQRGLLKLTALLRPTHAAPLTTLSLLSALARAPFALLATLPRIFYVAWILHYKKRLDVFLRPEPLPTRKNVISTPASPSDKKIPGGVKWQEEGFFARFARQKVELFLKVRARETDIEVTLISGNPSIPRRTFSPAKTGTTKSRLTIAYLSPRLFTILFLAPSPEHALLLGCDTEKIFRVSSRHLFLETFSADLSKALPISQLQGARSRGLPHSLPFRVPSLHYLDDGTFLDTIRSSLVIRALHFLDSLEEFVFTISHARVVEGQEPWKQWDRAAALFHDDTSKANLFPQTTALGSVRRERGMK